LLIYYYLSTKNIGFGSAKNVRVKIKDEQKKVWMNLALPFRVMLKEAHKNPARIKNLVVGRG